LLQKAGFFDSMAVILKGCIDKLGVSLIPSFNFAGACFLSALLDNNIVADFASRALHGLETGNVALVRHGADSGFTRQGDVGPTSDRPQSVWHMPLFGREVDERYTPVQWMKLMTPHHYCRFLS